MEHIDAAYIANLLKDRIGCPMPAEGTDLSNAQLSREQRLWLGLTVIAGHHKVRELANKWNMTYRQVLKYSYRLKRGRIPAERVGRPRNLDDESMQRLREAVAVTDMNSRWLLKVEADAAYTDTVKRRLCVVQTVDNIEMSMSKRSRNMYIAAICKEL